MTVSGSFNLQPGRWYAAEFIEAGDETLARHYSPVLVHGVRPLKTGRGVIRIDFHHENYPEGVQDKTYDLRILERGRVLLLGKRVDGEGLLLLHELNWAWLDEHFDLQPRDPADDPQLFKRLIGGAKSEGMLAAEATSAERFEACLVGGAVGDALGYPIEFTRDGPALRGAPPLDLTREADGLATVSDDTQMTMFCAEGLVRCFQRMHDRGICSGAAALEYAFDRWYATQVGLDEPLRWPEATGWLIHEPRLQHRRAPGNTCLSALAALREGAAVVNDSKGCGAVMRSAPIGLAGETQSWAFDLARDSGRSTHQHPSGYLSAAAFASIIQQVSRGARLAAAVERSLEQLAGEEGHEEVTSAILSALALKNDPLDRQQLEQLGEGWTGEEALAIAIRCALHAEEDAGLAETALWRSVAHCGDSDSTGSLTGNLLGARHGYAAVPRRWAAQVDLVSQITQLAADLHAAAVEGTALDTGRYPPH